VNCPRAALRVACFTTVLLGFSAAAWPAGAPSAADLARCAAMTAPDARLACYDNLAAQPPNAAAPATAGAAAKPPSPTPAAVAPAPPAAAAVTPPALAPPALPAATAPAFAPAAAAAATSAPAPAYASAPAPASTPAGSAASADDPRNFGFSPAHVHAAPQGPKSIRASVAAIRRNQVGTTYMTLDNGQTWMYIDEDGRLVPGDTVTIKRASLGSFLMVTPSKRSYHVQRVE